MDKNKKRNRKTFLLLSFPNSPTQSQSSCILLLIADYRETETVMLRVLLNSILSVQIVYSVQLNCTDSNYTQAAATCSAAQQHSTFTVQILYKLYSLQLNFTYSNYAQAAAKCSAAEQHSTFIVQILYKLYSLQLNFTYSNYTVAAATGSAAQQERNCQTGIFCSEEQTLVLKLHIVTHIQRLDPSNSRYWLQAQRRNLTVIRNKWMLQR